MTSTGLASPPQAALTRLEGPAAPPPVSEWPPTRRGQSKGNFEPRAVALSVVVHLLLILFLIVVARLQPPALIPRAAAPSGGTSFDIVLDFPAGDAGDLAPIAVPAAATPAASSAPAVVVPPFVRTPTRAPATQPGARIPAPGRAATPGGAGNAAGGNAGAASGAGAGTGAGSATGSGTSARDALRPGYRDPRLYAPVDEFPELRKTDHERYVEHLQSRIDAVNDSMGVESNRNRTTSDWTLTDADGDRWGLSPEGLHLGGVTIPRAVLPLPAATGDNQSLEAERERRRMREEIQRQEAERERAETERERVEATRRRDAEERARGGGN